MFERLKKRWNIQSNFQVLVILTVFAITGSTIVYVKKLIYELIGITPDVHLLVRIPLYIMVILVIYNLLLLFFGFLFGQFNFFWELERKFFSRLRLKRYRKTELA